MDQYKVCRDSVVYFSGTEEKCEEFLNNLIAENKNEYPIEEYEILPNHVNNL